MNVKKILKFAIVPLVLVVLYFLFKPKKAVAPVKKSTGNSGGSLTDELSKTLEALNDDDYEAQTKSYLYLTADQMAIVDSERQKRGSWNNGDDIPWGDFAANMKSQMGIETPKRAPYTGVFKGLDVNATGGGVWVFKEHGIFQRIKSITTTAGFLPHWDLDVGDYLV